MGRLKSGVDGSEGVGGGADGTFAKPWKEEYEDACRKTREPSSGRPSTSASGDRGGGREACGPSAKMSNTVRTGDVARELRREGAGERFANGSSSKRSGGGELREGVAGTIGEDAPL